ncbi:TIGR01212 family radical SAM protein [Acetivibrio saccincola]|jgi:radical SAM protein (TIGR01212 family)|uniref:Coproporphyrinogen III oxidase n=1 Tax=Acetivibrio saccincola TaxID=1677857 RepID=A0A2K9E978_9FIRM|nr:TIGR01212 family radical SAM protein [Acetivibrio saccincola]AUG58166.1 coproporphyrinogen III oxidase [Acetivibrio saccincola]NLW26710.1 TIGR01212 family radical SAM protein [Acetivibrio saccincola]PQQ68048.1 TIGR01212 family radical SAM protein [Acetivibrio saccincola]HOA96996.1 TIGR01212 family radical SAM protein [Acetivibrio saccincola]HQD27698.1 TIGR01212 family radical SAM protein [Acetivibrio saccincola]
MLYNKFSQYLKKRYNAKVYKLPVNLPVTCPNRDGRISKEGCIFCGEEGTGFENLPNYLSVKEQLLQNLKYIRKNYNSEKFIAYFQNYSNTYLPLEDFKRYIAEACMDGVVAIYISTRPDCIWKEYIEYLKDIKTTKGIDIVIELGLQTVNYHTLKKLNRGHLLAEFIHAVLLIKSYGLEVCAHYIVDIPMDSIDDTIEGARILSALRVEQVKCHSLYILKDTPIGEMYQRGEITPVSMEEYIERTISFLEYLSPDIVVQRLIGRAPEERTLFCNWGRSWWKVQELLEKKMEEENRFQGKKYNYLSSVSFFDG